jgi:hypothetical protein
MFANSSSADMNERKTLCEYLRATIEVFQNKTRESWENSQEMPRLEQADACKCPVARKLGDREMSRSRINESGNSGPFRWYAPDLSGATRLDWYATVWK